MTDLPTSDQLAATFYAALEAGDPKGVHSALTVMALVDPDRAARLLAAVQFGLALISDRRRTSDDLVVRLRARAASQYPLGLLRWSAEHHMAPIGDRDAAIIALANEAADEIERLRGLLAGER